MSFNLLLFYMRTDMQGRFGVNLITIYLCMVTLCVTVVFFIHLMKTAKAANVMFIFLVSLEGMLTFCRPNALISQRMIYNFSFVFWSRFSFALIMIEVTFFMIPG